MPQTFVAPIDQLNLDLLDLDWLDHLELDYPHRFFDQNLNFGSHYLERLKYKRRVVAAPIGPLNLGCFDQVDHHHFD